jgi:hypothetical protein
MPWRGGLVLAHIFRNKQGKLHPFWGRLAANLYPPFVGAGIRITATSNDYHFIRVEMPLTRLNANYVGVHFGGSLYAMTDPFYMLMLIQILGSKYRVWDSAAKITFLKPGKKRVIAEFRWTPDEIDNLRTLAADNEKHFIDKTVDILDVDGVKVAEVVKTLYVRHIP